MPTTKADLAIELLRTQQRLNVAEERLKIAAVALESFAKGMNYSMHQAAKAIEAEKYNPVPNFGYGSPEVYLGVNVNLVYKRLDFCAETAKLNWAIAANERRLKLLKEKNANA